MAGMLDGIRVIEYAASWRRRWRRCTLRSSAPTVIRVDPISGNSDIARWPLTKDGHSLYWASLNKGKRSIEIDIRSAGGRELLRDLIVAPGAGRGIFLTNMR